MIGIDLGTTNSAIAVWRDGGAQLIPNSLGEMLTPSAVSIDDDGQLLVGMAARERQVTHPALTATAFKRYMGTNRMTRLGAREFLPEELSALVLASLKADAEHYLGEPVKSAIITVPAYFNDKQRKATRRAGELAGLAVDRLINEPTAAALAYGIHRRQDETKFLVFDLGGGTFDVSILEIFEGVIEVRASTGDTYLGGEDFNEVLIQDFLRQHGTTLSFTSREQAPLLYEVLRDQAERARRQLTVEAVAKMVVSWKDQHFEYSVTVDQFETLCQRLLARLRDPVIRALRDSKVDLDQVKEIVLVGGATRMPVVRRAVTRMFGRFPATSLNPDEAVALGAAIQAGLKARDAALKEVVLTDVCPYTLGVDSGERRPDGSFRLDVFTPIIERNTVIPASREKRFTTLSDGQEKIALKIYQGESRIASENIYLGTIEMPVPPRRAREVAVTCRFTYDINGLLEVDVEVPATHERRQLVIFDRESGEPGIDLEHRRRDLAALKVHPREKDPNRAALARAARCFEHFLGEEREEVRRQLSTFEAALDTQDPVTADHARARLLKALDALEGKSFL
ncbi:MAG TPA: molecular chaperone HscC [Steroidobacteraceae bacterium]|nr:molecular chaperone HscC [Steroidobacteraceae bacterium]